MKGLACTKVKLRNSNSKEENCSMKKEQSIYVKRMGSKLKPSFGQTIVEEV